jgi:peptidoglycan/xylan/chitin deacetylase (PgdA/CDA1 family)
MRVAVVVVGSLVAGSVAFAAVEAQKYSLSTVASAVTDAIWPARKPSTTAAAPAETPNAKPAPRTVVADVPPTGSVQTGATAAASSPAASAPTTVAQAPTTPAPALQAPSAQSAPHAAAPAIPCANPNALGVSRVVEIDTTGGPGFGLEHFKMHDFLRDHEVVLTFDDGPWLNNTPMVLKALADQCLRATFFPIGKHATYYPDILKEVAEAGHTIGSHTWSHADLSKKTLDQAKDEIEMGISAVHMAVGAPTAPFFRFPALRHPPEVVTYLGQRNIAIFSTDIDSFDFKIHKPELVVKSVMDKLSKHGRGILLMHDFQRATAHALPELLNQLKANGYKVVHMRAKDQLQTLPQYDEMLLKEQKVPTVSQRPTSEVVHTISQ